MAAASSAASSSSSSGEKNKKKVPESFLHQLSILRALVKGQATGQPSIDIDAIASLSTIKDDKETLRYLYILEGQKLVTPVPPGDFTSRNWQITPEGVRALKTAERSQLPEVVG